MSDIIKMDYDAMEDMAAVFRQGAELLSQINKEAMAIANQMDDGALVGDGGAAFSAAIREKLCKGIGKLESKFTELNGDLVGAVKDMRDGDKTAVSRFK